MAISTKINSEQGTGYFLKGASHFPLYPRHTCSPFRRCASSRAECAAAAVPLPIAQRKDYASLLFLAATAATSSHWHGELLTIATHAQKTASPHTLSRFRLVSRFTWEPCRGPGAGIYASKATGKEALEVPDFQEMEKQQGKWGTGWSIFAGEGWSRARAGRFSRKHSGAVGFSRAFSLHRPEFL